VVETAAADRAHGAPTADKGSSPARRRRRPVRPVHRRGSLRRRQRPKSSPKRATRSPTVACHAAREGLDELPILDFDHVNVGPYIRNTLRSTRTPPRGALFDIYRVMRRASRRRSIAPRRCSTRCSSTRNATTCLGGRVDEHATSISTRRHMRILRKGRHSSRWSGAGRPARRPRQIDDIDHLGNRRVARSAS